jgi:hypothetical protein
MPKRPLIRSILFCPLLASGAVLVATGAAAPGDRPILRYTPKHAELKYTFGGVAPTHHVKPGTRIVSWTEDCFDGAVTRPGQLPTKVVPPGHDNPQTGPFYVDGAEPGDTLAITIDKLEPARDQGLSSFFPGFGALSGTDRTALLGPPPQAGEESVGLLPRAARPGRSFALRRRPGPARRSTGIHSWGPA